MPARASHRPQRRCRTWRGRGRRRPRTPSAGSRCSRWPRRSSLPRLARVAQQLQGSQNAPGDVHRASTGGSGHPTAAKRLEVGVVVPGDLHHVTDRQPEVAQQSCVDRHLVGGDGSAPLHQDAVRPWAGLDVDLGQHAATVVEPVSLLREREERREGGDMSALDAGVVEQLPHPGELSLRALREGGNPVRRDVPLGDEAVDRCASSTGGGRRRHRDAGDETDRQHEHDDARATSPHDRTCEIARRTHWAIVAVGSRCNQGGTTPRRPPVDHPGGRWEFATQRTRSPEPGGSARLRLP